jgi:translocation and assembly module TamA
MGCIRRLGPVAMLLALAGCARGRPDRWVDEIRLRGNHAVSDKDIKSGLATRETSWRPFARRQPFDPAALEVDRRRIQRLYAERGYLEARVGPPEIEPGDDGAVDIVLPIEEGQPSVVHELRLHGVPGLDPRMERRLRARLGVSAGERLDYSRYQQARAELLAHLRERGYAYASVSGRIWAVRADRRAVVELVARPGPLVRLRGLRISGAGGIPERIIHLQRPWRPGELYEPEQLGLLTRRLSALGVFSTVSVTLPRPPSAEPDVEVRLAPAKLQRLRLGGGVGLELRRHEVRLLGEWTHNNFLGGLRRLRLQLKPAWVFIPTYWDPQRTGPALSAEAELRQPFLLGTRFAAAGLVGYDLEVEEGYRYHGPRTRLLVERPFLGDLLRLGLSWNLEYLMFFDINPAVFNPAVTPLGLGFRESYRLAWLEPWAVLDWRDQPLDARRGVYFEARLELGLPEVGGNFRYLKISPDLRGYLPMGGRLTLAARAALGWLHPLGQEDSPITRRYTLGGPTSHRGFSYGRLSPQAPDPASGRSIPIGGNGSLLFSLEARLRIFKAFGYWINLVPFADAGDVVPRFRDLDLSALHLAVGGSLAYETPVGVVQAGVGVRLNRLSGLGPDGVPNPDPGDRLAFHITLGGAF